MFLNNLTLSVNIFMSLSGSVHTSDVKYWSSSLFILQGFSVAVEITVKP